MDWSKIKYFKEDEFKCKHCGDCNMDQSFIEKLDDIRERMGSPLRVTSGYRCPVHNAAVSSTGNAGPHTTGKAADLQTTEWRKLLELAVNNFPGIGIQLTGSQSARFIHVDDLGYRTWGY